MKSDFYKYLQTLDKEKLIEMIYQPRVDERSLPYVSRRTIALRMSYDGRRYSGIAPQEGKNTIGGHLLNALMISGLGDKPVYAGRTDAGVSGMNMIVSINVISRIEEPNRGYDLNEDDYKEYRYDLILNTYLPVDIRIIGWAPVPDTFSARFTCIQRRYRYYIHKDNNSLEKMNEIALTIKGMTNFYHLSKHSNKNARYDRTLDECKVVDDGDVYYLDIRARGFLHNMVRKIVWVIQKGGEYDIERVGMVSPYPLIFCGAMYPDALHFINDHRCREIFHDQLKYDHIRYKMSKIQLEYLEMDMNLE